jgi:hypothetical protein
MLTPISKCLMFDFFDINFDYLYYLKYEKYNIIYYTILHPFCYELVLPTTTIGEWMKYILKQLIKISMKKSILEFEDGGMFLDPGDPFLHLSKPALD